MNNCFDVDLDDHELRTEILLLTDLMIAASESTQPLSQAVIDACLHPAVAVVWAYHAQMAPPSENSSPGPAREVGETGPCGSTALNRAEQATDALLRGAHLAGGHDLPDLLVQHAEVLGCHDALTYLTDLQQRVLVPFLPPRPNHRGATRGARGGLDRRRSSLPAAADPDPGPRRGGSEPGPDPGVAAARGRDRTPRRPRGHHRGRLDAGGRRRPADRSAAAARVPDRGARDDQDAVRRHDRPDAPDRPDGAGRRDPVVPAATHHVRQRDRHGRGWAGTCLRGRRRLPGLRRGRGRRPVRGLRRDGARPRQRPADQPGGGGVPQRAPVRPDPDRDGGAHRRRGLRDLPGRGVRHRPARRAATR